MPRVPPAHAVALAATYAATLAVRLLYWHAPPYGDEGAFFATARHLWHAPANVYDLYVPGPIDRSPNVLYRPIPIFWYRPASFLLLAPAAAISFDAYRFWFAALTSFLPVLGVLLLRDRGVRAPLAYGAGLLLVLHPAIAVWSALTLPDALMATLFAAALWAHLRGRPVAAAAFALLAIWTKETAWVGAAWLFASAAAQGRREGTSSLWPLRLDERQTLYLGVLALGPLPILYTFARGGPVPGGYTPADPLGLLESLLLVPWLLPLILLGLRWPRTRSVAGISALHTGFYLVYGIALGRGVNIWYLVLPVFLSVVAAAFAFDEAWNRARRRLPRVAVAAAALLLAAILATYLVVPNTVPKGWFIKPLTGTRENSLAESVEYEHARDADFLAAHAAMLLGPGVTVLAVEVYGSYVLHPLGTQAGAVFMGEPYAVRVFHQDLTPWNRTIEERANYTLVARSPEPLNEAVRLVYADCVELQNPTYVVILGQECPGRGERLRAEYEARLPAVDEPVRWR